MINLLSETEKEVLRREYRRRIIVLGEALLIAAFAAAGVLFIPAYFVASEQYATYAAQDALFTGEKASSTNAVLADVRFLKSELALLRPAVPAQNISGAVGSIIDRRGNGITVRAFDYQSKGKASVLSIEGVAITREALLSFVTRLKADPRFAEVCSPISNLVKDSNIEFSIQISLH